MKIKKKINYNILYATLAWIGGFIILFSIWSIISACKKGTSFTLPSIFQSFYGFGKIVAGKSMVGIPNATAFVGKEWAAIGISIGQALFCFLISGLLALILAILTYYVRFFQYLFWPFITITRAIPTAVIMCFATIFIFQKTVWLLPIIVSFFIIFPILYEAFNNAILNISKFKIQMGKVYQVSRWNQFRKIVLPSCAPYMLSACVAGFGLTIKTIWASQVLSFLLVGNSWNPNYQSVGKIIATLISYLNNNNVLTHWNISPPSHVDACSIIVGWAIMAVLISLIVEVGLKYLAKLISPYSRKRRFNA